MCIPDELPSNPPSPLHSIKGFPYTNARRLKISREIIYRWRASNTLESTIAVFRHGICRQSRRRSPSTRHGRQRRLLMTWVPRKSWRLRAPSSGGTAPAATCALLSHDTYRLVNPDLTPECINQAVNVFTLLCC